MNAKEELLKFLDGKPRLKCASIDMDRYDNRDAYDAPPRVFELPVGYTKEQGDAFTDKLDFNYSAGYGGQELFGTLWLEDGSWCDRGEYDGSEWWQHHSLPEIPSELLPQRLLTGTQDPQN